MKLFFVFFLALSLPCLAATIHVPADQPTIQAGIDAAAAGDSVIVAAGLYTWAGEGSGYEGEYGWSLIQMKSGVTCSSETGEADCVTIDAQHQGRVFYCDGIDSAASIIGFTIENGGTSGDPPYRDGGGVIVRYSQMILRNCILKNNSAYGDGGGVYSYKSSVTLESCKFIANEASRGGGFLCYDHEPILMNCVFLENSAIHGGGMLGQDSDLSLQSCSFLSNIAFEGGGLYFHGNSSSVLSSCDIEDNTASNTGGGMYFYESSSTITSCTLLRNQAHIGGGIYHIRSPLTLAGCIFVENTTNESGGAIYTSSSSLLLTTCFIARNSCATNGGGVRCASYSDFEAIGCTFACNSAALGGAIDCSYTPSVIINCLIAFSENGEGVGGHASSFTLTCTDIFGNIGGDWIGVIAGQSGINGNISEDPLFCDPDMGDFSLRNDSPCAPDNNDCGVLMGAWPVGCSTSVGDATWSQLKMLY